mmetsp:Transcript_34182/g.84620  ORF Transcript_34182/g.84620 Transcript_34182/m.84620 type:complete len:285 (-) Transcript_34182:637-1491(-)
MITTASLQTIEKKSEAWGVGECMCVCACGHVCLVDLDKGSELTGSRVLNGPALPSFPAHRVSIASQHLPCCREGGQRVFWEGLWRRQDGTQIHVGRLAIHSVPPCQPMTRYNSVTFHTYIHTLTVSPYASDARPTHKRSRRGTKGKQDDKERGPSVYLSVSSGKSKLSASVSLVAEFVWWVVSEVKPKTLVEGSAPASAHANSPIHPSTSIIKIASLQDTMIIIRHGNDPLVCPPQAFLVSRMCPCSHCTPTTHAAPARAVFLACWPASAEGGASEQGHNETHQ